MPNSRFSDRTAELIEGLRASGQLKEFLELTGPLGATANLHGHGEVVVLCSNNYLGLANHEEVIAAGVEGLKRYGAGTASVRFICGTLQCHLELEQSIARFVGAEAALTYTSCFAANEALIATVAGENDVLISDELNHASIIDGCRLARKTPRDVYRHNDLADLEAKLTAHTDRETAWVITDGVFSMEGDVARLAEMIAICRRREAMLIVDDSHGVGVLGRGGRGTPELHDVLGQVDLLTGTLGKALGGAAGGYVAGSRAVIELLKQRSRPSLFSNALPATVACSARRAIEIVAREPQRVARLHANVKKLREGLIRLGYDCHPRAERGPSGADITASTAIIPILIGDAAEAIKKSRRLMEMGVMVIAFGYPVVPQGQARLRVQVSAALEEEHLERALAAFAQL